MPKDIKITEEEKKALEEYQGTYYKIINTLLRKGIISEETINSKKGKNYIPPTNKELKEAIDCIKNIYSAIIKSTIADKNNLESKPIYRGTQISIIQQMMKNEKVTSFLSTTTNKNQTTNFSRTYSKDEMINPEDDKAFLMVEGNVPHINLEEFLGGMEDEIIFAPARFEIIEGINGIASDDEIHMKKYGKPYTLKLTPLEIPEMPTEEIERLRESIFNRNEQMGKILNAIMQMKQFPNLSDPNSLNSIINKYSQWKEDFIKYCYQEFRIIEKNLGYEYDKYNEINIDDLENVGRARLGGTGEMYLLKNNKGEEYLFKPAVSKFDDKEENFRADIQEAAYKVQKIVNPQAAIKCNIAIIDGKYGAIQEKIMTRKDGFDLLKWQREGGEIPKDILDGIMREYVVDYLLCNFDTHARNFIIGEDGIVRGVDKEQAFKYIKEKDSKKPSKDYHPNKKYKELEPIYNTIFQRFIKGELDLDFNIIYECIDRVEQIDNKDYEEIFTKYANLLSEEQSENILKLIVERKEKMKENITCFIEQVKAERELKNKHLDTTKLGKETWEEQEDTFAKDDMDIQMGSNNRDKQSQQKYQENPETKRRTDSNPESFMNSLRFEIPIDVELEIVENNKKMQENFEKEVSENQEKKKSDPTEYGVR